MTDILIFYVETAKYLENTLSLSPRQLNLNFDSAN